MRLALNRAAKISLNVNSSCYIIESPRPVFAARVRLLPPVSGYYRPCPVFACQLHRGSKNLQPGTAQSRFQAVFSRRVAGRPTKMHSEADLVGLSLIRNSHRVAGFRSGWNRNRFFTSFSILRLILRALFRFLLYVYPFLICFVKIMTASSNLSYKSFETAPLEI